MVGSVADPGIDCVAVAGLREAFNQAHEAGLGCGALATAAAEELGEDGAESGTAAAAAQNAAED